MPQPQNLYVCKPETEDFAIFLPQCHRMKTPYASLCLTAFFPLSPTAKLLPSTVLFLLLLECLVSHFSIFSVASSLFQCFSES